MLDVPAAWSALTATYSDASTAHTHQLPKSLFLFVKAIPLLMNGKDSVIVGNGSALNISHINTSNLSGDVNLLDVLVVSHIKKNLLSISKLTADYPVDVVFS